MRNEVTISCCTNVRMLTFRTPTAVLIEFRLKLSRVSELSSLVNEFVAAVVLMKIRVSSISIVYRCSMIVSRKCIVSSLVIISLILVRTGIVVRTSVRSFLDRLNALRTVGTWATNDVKVNFR